MNPKLATKDPGLVKYDGGENNVFNGGGLVK